MLRRGVGAVAVAAAAAVGCTADRRGDSAPATGGVTVSMVLAVDSAAPDFPLVIEDAAPLPGGGVVVLDAPLGRLHYYDSSGAHVQEVGASGAGPGELRRPTEVVVDDRGRVIVNDLGNRRLVVWDASGRHVGTYPLAGMYLHLVYGAAGVRVKHLDLDESTGEETLVLKAVPDSTTGAEAVRLSLSAATETPSRPALTCEYCPAVVARDGVALVGARDGQYRIYRISPSGRVLDSLWRSDLAPVDWAPEEIEEVMAAMRRKGLTSRPGFLDQPKRQLGPRAFALLSDSLLVVMPTTPHGLPGRLDVWSRADSLLASLQVSEPLVQIRGGANRIVGIAEWPDGSRSVHVYELRLGGLRL